MPLSNRTAILSWSLQLLTAAILLQTLFFKFTGAEESIYIFQTLGLEPIGRIGSGIAELIAVILLLTPRTVVFGAMLSLGVITGAIASHLTTLGIVVMNDGGLLFTLAIIVFLASVSVLVIRRAQIPFVGSMLGARATRNQLVPSHGHEHSISNRVQQ